MLTLTDRAVNAVKEIVATSEADSDTGGLRMAANPTASASNFQISVAALPGEDDQVVEEHGARLFLDQQAAQLLDDKVLDAIVEPDQVAFTLADQ
jgi:Fe-S cluster assembly iron-binding protein IscA